MLEDAAKFQEL
jgi:hypothetical protein